METKTRTPFHSLFTNLSRFFVCVLIFGVGLVPGSMGVSAQVSDGDGVLPEAVLETYPAMDPRLIGAPIRKTDVTAALVAYSRAVQNVNNLEFEKTTLERSIEILTPQEIKAKLDFQERTKELDEVNEAYNAIIRAKYQEASNNRKQESDVWEESDQLRLSHQSLIASDSLRTWKEKAQKRKKASKEYLDLIEEKISESKSRITQIGEELNGARQEAQDRSNVVRTGVPVAVIVGLDIPVLTMDAYLRAERTMATNQPECGIAWWSLAAIGRAESNHGRYGGATLGNDGTVTPPIIGVQLNGNGFAAIKDSDAGLLDGDTQWDRAVGVMQFIPGTWNRWGADGNGDGVADPQNVYDGALSGARYLCSSAQPNMTTDEGRRRAFMAYNRSRPYVDFVATRGYEYNDMTAGRFNLIPAQR